MGNEVRIGIKATNMTKSDFDAVKKDSMSLKDVMVSIESQNMTKSDFLAVKKDVDSVKDVDIDIDAENNTKDEFKQVKDDLDGLVKKSKDSGKQSGSDFGKNFLAEGKKAFTQAKAQLTPMLVYAGIAAAPLIAAALQGAVVGGLGTGGVLGGVLLVSRDPKIKAAGRDLGKSLLSELTASASTSFVGPMLKSIESIRSGFISLRPTLDSIFKNSAGLLQPLTDGLIGGVRGILTGIDTAIKNSGPAVDALAEGFTQLGEAVGDFFAELSEDPEAGAAGLRSIFDTVSGLLEILGPTIAALGQVNLWLEKIGFSGGFLTSFYTLMRDDAPGEFTKHIQGADEAMQGLTSTNETYNQVLSETLKAQDDAIAGLQFFTDYQKDGTDQVNAWTTAQLASQEAMQGSADALDELANAHKALIDPAFNLLRTQNKLNEAQDDYTEAVQKFGKNSPEAQEALLALTEKTLAFEGAVGDAAGALEGGITPALKSTLQAAGWTDEQIAELAKQFRIAEKRGDEFAKDYEASARVNGVGTAKSKVNSILDDLRAFDGVWTATMVTNYIKHGKPGTGGGLAHGGIKGAANGATSSGLTLTGEYGPELVDLPAGARVTPAGGTKSLIENMNVGGSSEPIEIVINSSGSDVDNMLLAILQKAVRVRGGNVQVVIGSN